MKTFKAKTSMMMMAITVLLTVLFGAITILSFGTPVTVKAIEPKELESYYDLDENGCFSICDAVLAYKLVEEGRLSYSDYENVVKLMLGEPVNMEFEEFDIDDLEVNDDTIFTMQTIVFSYCVGYEFESYGSVRYRYLNDGKITEWRCSRFSSNEVNFGILEKDGVQNVLGIAKDKFAIDENISFDLPHKFNEYEFWDLDDTTPSFAKCLLKSSGKFESFVVDLSNEETTSVRFKFNNGFTCREFSIERIEPVVEILGSYVYEQERINIGVTADGKVALDTYSFDIAE
ncbi:MAG: hypothetical protein J6K42_02295 [Clostridia bacterium]|nr:hypothetical protein [Clostridia bacterium]